MLLSALSPSQRPPLITAIGGISTVSRLSSPNHSYHPDLTINLPPFPLHYCLFVCVSDPELSLDFFQPSMFPLQQALKALLLAVCGGSDLLLENVCLVSCNGETERAESIERSASLSAHSLLRLMYPKTTADSSAAL